MSWEGTISTNAPNEYYILMSTSYNIVVSFPFSCFTSVPTIASRKHFCCPDVKILLLGNMQPRPADSPDREVMNAIMMYKM